MSILVSEAGKGQVVKLDGQTFQIIDREHRTPGNLRAFIQLKLKNLDSGAQFVKRFAVDDRLEPVFLERRPCQYLYPEGKQGFVFMDNENYEQFHLSAEVLGDTMKYITENATVDVVYVEEVPLTVQIPPSVVLEIVSCEEAVKGDTVSNIQKGAKLETGLEIKVPLHIKVGERVKVNTDSGEFAGRANDG